MWDNVGQRGTTWDNMGQHGYCTILEKRMGQRLPSREASYNSFRLALLRYAAPAGGDSCPTCHIPSREASYNSLRLALLRYAAPAWGDSCPTCHMCPTIFPHIIDIAVFIGILSFTRNCESVASRITYNPSSLV